MKNRIQISLIFLFILSGFLFVARFSYAVKAKSIDYIPRDQELVTTEKNYTTPYILSEVNCDEDLLKLNTKISRCYDCQQLKTNCSDCCINMTGVRETKCKALTDAAKLQPPIFQPITSHDSRKACTMVKDCQDHLLSNKPETDPGSTDSSYTDFKDYCSDPTDTGIPGCQAQGCPDSSGEPEYYGAVKCEGPDAAGAFICNTRTINELASPGCEPSGSAVTDCTTLKHTPVRIGGSGGGGGGGGGMDNGMYIITKMDDADCAAAGFSSSCWEYQLTDELKKCISDCKDAADAQERLAKNLDCCNRDSDICVSSSDSIKGLNAARPGYQNNCPNDDVCSKRVDWPECQPGADTIPSFCCDNLTAGDCIDLSKLRDEAIANLTTGTSFLCFRDISKPEDALTYEFVAKSNEKLMVIWQVQTSPEYFYCGSDAACTSDQEDACADDDPSCEWGNSAPNTYFYTLIKIFDMSDKNQEVYPYPYADTVMNQKSFTASFSVFAAIATGKDNATGKSIFKQGHKYQIKLYYFIAPLSNYVLRSKISHLQFMVLRVRE